MADVFISYAREDHNYAGQLAAAFEKQQLTVWWDREILAGKAFDEAIERELEAAKSVVVLWSKHSVSSEWVKNEAAAAVERDVLVPILIDRVRPPLEFRRRQTADLVEWHGDIENSAFVMVCRAVTSNAGRVLRTLNATPPSSSAHQRLVGISSGATVKLAIGVAIALGISFFFFYHRQVNPLPKPPYTLPTKSVNVYTHPSGSFEKHEEKWIEYPSYSPGRNYTFNEARRDDKFIYLYDNTRHKDNDPSRIMYMRLPIAGGMAQWSYPNPFIWQDLYPVTPKQ